MMEHLGADAPFFNIPHPESCIYEAEVSSLQ
ncbi:hypothetical protein FHS18_005084 [Paenibacillus phyllosphaerae]|uniref:Uncharacterized protein n=1 Tax=Paenibacillus phyllosphaerae TaxID=274593 RepID=A0A7W5B2E8_9BACL|nr:hypothetical protein [Paenibacillus phyllosphaerae]